MMHFLLNALFGLLMFWCHLHQLRLNTAFAVLSAIFFGLAGIGTRGGIPQIFQHAAISALGRIICGPNPPKRTSERSPRSPFARR